MTACRDVQGDQVTPSIEVYCMEHQDFLIVSKYTLGWLDAVLPFYLPFLHVSE